MISGFPKLTLQARDARDPDGNVVEAWELHERGCTNASLQGAG